MKPIIFKPAYLRTSCNGLLQEKITKAFRILEHCSLCPRSCGANRLKNERGTCGAGCLPEISSYSPHFGEERPLVGFFGSGTIFLTHCNLKCVFCQNFSISHLGDGNQVSFERLGNMMLELQKLGCHNINFVSPTHYVPQILKALSYAIEKGLSVPLVYNTGGYDSLETLRLLDGVVDIYMPDMKYSQEEAAKQYSQAPDYPLIAKLAIKEMHRQVGDLCLDGRGIARRGLLVRHLVLPMGLAGTREAMRFFASEISRNTYVNIMDQYFPSGEIPLNSPLRRRITKEEFDDAVKMAKEEGLHRLDKE